MKAIWADRNQSGAAMNRAGALIVLLLFWGLTMWNLDRVPSIHNDEPTIAAPGYKFFTQGILGLDMYTGFYHQEQAELEIMPLMSLLQGAGLQLWGVSVWSMRFWPVMLGALTLVLTYALARQMSNASVGLLAMVLLIFWQWAPGGAQFVGSGIPLIDVSRLARYDILTAPLGLAALLCFIHASRTRSLRFDFASGVLCGLAGLTNLYGLFWLIVLLILIPIDRRDAPPRGGSIFRRAGSILMGAILISLPWLIYALSHWSDLISQYTLHAGRFEVFNPVFYLTNLVHEVQRYELGMHDSQTFIRLGFWLLVIGVPLSMIWWLRRAAAARDHAAWWLLVPCLTWPLLLGLLISVKRFYYLIAVAPLFAILLGWALMNLLSSIRRNRKWLASAALAILIFQGTLSIARLQTAASIGSPEVFDAQLRQVVPANITRIYGPHQYWFAFYDRQYRAFLLPLFMMGVNHISFEAAMDQVQPEIVVLNPYVIDILSQMEPCDQTPCAEPWAYLRQHQAALIAELPDSDGALVQVYQVQP